MGQIFSGFCHAFSSGVLIIFPDNESVIVERTVLYSCGESISLGKPI
jgi:hypothetical protein